MRGRPARGGPHGTFVGLLPGRYTLGISLAASSESPEYWYAGSSFEDATEVDLTSGDVTGVQIDLASVEVPTE